MAFIIPGMYPRWRVEACFNAAVETPQRPLCLRADFHLHSLFHFSDQSRFISWNLCGELAQHNRYLGPIFLSETGWTLGGSVGFSCPAGGRKKRKRKKKKKKEKKRKEKKKNLIQECDLSPQENQPCATQYSAPFSDHLGSLWLISW